MRKGGCPCTSRTGSWLGASSSGRSRLPALLREMMAEQGLPVPPDEGLIRGTYQEDETTEQRLLKDGRTRQNRYGVPPEPEVKDPETSTIKKQ